MTWKVASQATFSARFTGVKVARSWQSFLRGASDPLTQASLLRYLFPNASQLAKKRLFHFRYSYLPALRYKAHSRIYRLLVDRQARKQQRREAGVQESHRRRRLLHLRRRTGKDDPAADGHNMAYAAPGNGLAYGEYEPAQGEVRESGSKRKKLAGYLKAANELRHSYFSGDGARDGNDESGIDGPGAFPDAAVVRNGNEEMILFPSYAKRHIKSTEQSIPGMRDQDHWMQEWERRRGPDTAVVDVDVRGWIYTPHRGPASRRQRLLIGLARQLSGISAPTATKPTDSSYSSAAPSRASSPARARQEEDLIALEAEHIIRRGQEEELFARRGAFSEESGKGNDFDSIYVGQSRNSSPDRGRQGSESSRLSRLSIASSDDGDPGSMTPVDKRSSWSQPSKMSTAELAVANGHLLSRLKPFMANALANIPITAFFYNDSDSKQFTVYTNASGHFACRAPLPFVPTHVRVLAAETLSATEEVHITSPKGVSLISDIDDTVKHSAISAGAREIFRNAFIRDLGDLTIEGVREWYTTLYEMGAKIHYVSNSPWQMYPLLTSFFKLAKLPRGSFHLKQYTGMLQGIFEPVAERKKSSLDKIMIDFPQRKFILVGDSGEADLEVYSDVAQANPGRILGIFIRDVTTPVQTGYFDPSVSSIGPGKHSRNHSRHRSGDSLAMSKRFSRPDDVRNDDGDLKAAIAASLSDMEEEMRRAHDTINSDGQGFSRSGGPDERMRRPVPLQRPQTKRQISPEAQMTTSPEEEDLIDFTDEKPSSSRWLEPPSRQITPKAGNGVGISHKPPASPPPPPKPQELRVPPRKLQADQPPDRNHKPPPPRPRKPSSAVKPPSPQPPQTAIARPPSPKRPQTAIARPSPLHPLLPHAQTQNQTHNPSPLSQVSDQDSPTTTKERPPLPERPKTLRGLTSEKLSNVYHSLPSSRSYWQGDGAQGPPRPPTSSGNYAAIPRSISTTSTKSLEELHNFNKQPVKAVPPPPPRHNISSLPTVTSKKSLNRLSGSWEDDRLPSTLGESMNKKEYLWRQRWATAQYKLDRLGVTLRSWRVGSDVADVCVKLAEMELRKVEKEPPDIR